MTHDETMLQLDGVRRVRSYVRREGRMTPAQIRALDSYWSQWGLDPDDSAGDLFAAFGENHCPNVLEIGFGMGDSLFQMACENPDRRFIGIEPHRPGVGHLLQLIHKGGIDNLRLVCGDALDVIENHLAEQSVDCVQVFFPDPWHKKRHHKRRLINRSFVDLLAPKLREGGILHLATDWENYAESMCEAVMYSGKLTPCSPPARPETKYERRGVRLGHTITDLAFARIQHS